MTSLLRSGGSRMRMRRSRAAALAISPAPRGHFLVVHFLDAAVAEHRSPLFYGQSKAGCQCPARLPSCSRSSLFE
ncbi:hypothetical protein EVAR_60800_1 [Eumeta japonica]|uniref:Uncharacterized protein n=1 Tax=Eumeta variegata TaxID=151549 RepID=A0A4C1YIN7_EUMVA|nr:hypothetical protein EVAR_60800_1 [Eumeta japonica]